MSPIKNAPEKFTATNLKANVIQISKMSDLKATGTIHLSGITGSAMNGLAIILKNSGFQVTGTDPGLNIEAARRLAKNNITVHSVQDGSKIPEAAQLLVATAALSPDHPELKVAKSRGIPILKYADMLGLLLNESNGIAIAGTHGKTTTTALTVAALKGAGVMPGFLVGSVIPELGSGADAGNSEVFVAEACEYDRSFLKLKPKRAVITNIEADHLDIYKNLDEIVATFKDFVSGIPAGGVLFYNADCENASAVARQSSVRTVSFSCTGDAMVQARNISHENQLTRFDLYVNGAKIDECTIRLPGVHNVSNALAALAVGLDLDLPANALINGAATFGGIKRRFEIVDELSGITIIDDYAHHPTEIKALIKGAKERYVGQKLVIAFQPHQRSRTRLLFGDFAAAFKGADKVLITEIFAARDEEIIDDKYSACALADKIKALGTDTGFYPSFEEAINHGVKILKPGDIFITVGAGDIYKIASRLAEVLRGSPRFSNNV